MLVLALNACYLSVILIFLVVTARYLVVTGGCFSLLVVTVRYHSVLFVTTLSMNDFIYIFCRSFMYLNRKKAF